MPDNCGWGATREPAHCRGAISKSAFPTVQASSCAQHPSNALQISSTTVCSPSDHVVQIHDGTMLSNQKHSQQHLDFWPTHQCFFFWSRRPFPHPLGRLHLGFNIIPINPRLVSCYYVLKKISLPFALASSSWLISTRFSFWSSDNKRGTNFAQTRRIWSFSVKIWWQDPMLMPTSSATSRTVKRRFPRITARTL